MKTQNTQKRNTLFLIFVFTLFSISAMAQSSNIRKRDHMGLTVSFGTRAQDITSDIAVLDKMPVTFEGGSAGVLFGSQLVETKFTFGFYYSAASVPRTLNMVQFELSNNFHFLNLINSNPRKLSPYLIGAVNHNNYRFFGKYISTETNGAKNRGANEPYLGKVINYVLVGGIGMELMLQQTDNFVKLFTEVKYGQAIAGRADTAFSNTKLNDQLSINLGVSFGPNYFIRKK